MTTGPHTLHTLTAIVDELCGPSTGDELIDAAITDQMVNLLVSWGYCRRENDGWWLDDVDPHIWNGFVAHACRVGYALASGARPHGNRTDDQPDRKDPGFFF